MVILDPFRSNKMITEHAVIIRVMLSRMGLVIVIGYGDLGNVRFLDL